MLLVDWQIRALCIDTYDEDKRLWKPFPKERSMLFPFSEPVSVGGVISYGLTSSGYDLRLGHKYKVFKNPYNTIVNPKMMKTDPTYAARFLEDCAVSKDGEAIIIPNNSYILGHSLEHISMPNHLSGTCVGKSTYARCGIIVNTTPLEPGWRGHLTIEIANVSPCPVALFAAEGIAQLRFEQLAGNPEQNYEHKKGKYQDQKAEPVPATVKD